MPELPEVETVRRGLEPVLAGARLARVTARRADLRFPFPDGFGQRLTGARIEALRRRGKYILAPLDRGETLIIHLGMTGRFVIDDPRARRPTGDFALAAPADPKHAHVVFETEAGAVVTYFDARRFGFMDLTADGAIDAHPRFAGMGPEPLGAAFDADYLAATFAGRRQAIKAVLLDQHVVAGLGNIYVNETLYRARISPFTAAGALTNRQRAAVVTTVRSVLDEAIEAGGSTLRDYANAEGAMGYFQHAFQVYGRAGEACRTAKCGGVVERAVQSGRSTFSCPRCQR